MTVGGARRRVLAIDGGGVRGVYPAAYLAVVEEVVGQPIASFFDLIVGTSTGGIIALGLGLGVPAPEILAFYKTDAATVFRRGGLVGAARWLFQSKHDQSDLRAALTSRLGERKLGESTTRLVIPATELQSGDVHLFKTSHHPRFKIDYKLRAVDVALATAAAPTYFPALVTEETGALIDGGLWANNPAGVAAVEAVGVLDWRRGEIDLLSLGTTEQPLDAGRGPAQALGLRFWWRRALPALLSAQSQAAMGTAYSLLGHDHVFRETTIVHKGTFGLDRLQDIPRLEGLGSRAARAGLGRLCDVFFNEPAQPFAPANSLS